MATDYLIESVSDTQSVTSTYSPAVSLPYSFDLGAYANKCRQFIFYCSAYNPQTGDVEEQLSVNGIITDDGCELLWEHGVTATYYASTSRISIRTIPPYDGWQGRLNRYNLAIVTNDSTLGIVVADQSKTNYDAIPTTIYQYGMDMPVTSLTNCFKSCTSLTTAPIIPSSVTNMESCFRDCTSLTQAPAIPNSVTDIRYCFYNCTSLTGDIYIYTPQSQMGYCFYGTTQPITLHAMNDNIEVCDLLVATANNGNIFVNIHSETSISFTDTQMNYMTNEGLKTLSLQTNANLVQCEIPDLAHGGTITTNVNDALIDLWRRGGIINERGGA